MMLDAKSLVDGLYEALRNQDFEKCQTYLHPDYQSETQPEETGPDAFRRSHEQLLGGAHRIERRVLHALSEHDMVCCLHEFSIYPKAEAVPVCVRVADFYEIRDGLLFRHWDAVQFLP
jgi:predicted SnoaL-like aldol condensation-catalyzing enzyme